MHSQNIQLLQDIASITFSTPSRYLAVLAIFFWLEMNGAVFILLKSLQNIHKSLLYFYILFWICFFPSLLISASLGFYLAYFSVFFAFSALILIFSASLLLISKFLLFLSIFFRFFCHFQLYFYYFYFLFSSSCVFRRPLEDSLLSFCKFQQSFI